MSFLFPVSTMWSVYTKDDRRKYKIQCDDCRRWFRSRKCFQNHKEKSMLTVNNTKIPICRQFSICKYCFKFVNIAILRRNGIRRHRCHLRWCPTCKSETNHTHSCCIQKYTKEMPSKFKIVFYDIETVQTKKVFDRNDHIQFEHEPILVCAQQVCEWCWKIPETDFVGCGNCEQRDFYFEGRNCLLEFANFLIRYQPGKQITTCIAHNSSSFDSQLILNTLLKIPNANIELCSRGFKLLRIKFKKYIHFIDSLMFLPMALAKFPKAFGLDQRLTKGFFPFLFLSFENWDYNGVIPTKNFFNFDSFSDERKHEFDVWYQNNIKMIYNLRDEAIYYCTNDVNLLRIG